MHNGYTLPVIFALQSTPMFRKITLSLCTLLVSALSIAAQTIGDTIVVQAFNYNSLTRDTSISFPNDPSLSFEKIIMHYNMRCKDARVSNGSNPDRGCGEWDYSCNTYITDPNHLDSTIAQHPDYSISGFSGTTYPYKTTATNNYYLQIQKGVSIDSVLSESLYVFGNGSNSVSKLLETDQHAGRSQYLFTAQELGAAGITTGNIDGLSLEVSANAGLAKMFRVRIKAVSDTVLSNIQPHNDGFTEVYFKQHYFTSGTNRIQFYNPFNWNGSDNLLIDFSFTNKSSSSQIQFAGDGLSNNGLSNAGDNYFSFDGGNTIEAHSYRGIQGDTLRTIEAWIKTSVANKEIIGWGTNSNSQKYTVRLNGGGELRAEVNGSASIGTTNLADGQWHHIAVVHTGTNIGSVDFYVDGVLDPKSSTGNLIMNTGNNRKVQVGVSYNGQPFEGEIAELRVWKGALNATEIQDWMYRALDNSHPQFSDLQLYYPLNEGAGNAILDWSAHNRSASVQSHAIWSQFYGTEHFKRWEQNNNRPKTGFYQGNYLLTVSNDSIYDTVANISNLVNEYQVFPMYGTNKSDSIGLINQYNYWEADFEYVYDENGNLISTIPLTADGTITIGNLSYYTRSSSKFEIMSFVTPYGIDLDMGQNGETWAFDVSDFAPILKGDRRITMERGGEWQEDMDIKFLFIVGTPPRDVLDIQQIWPVSKRSYNNISSNSYFEPRNVATNANASFYKIRSMITGHGQEGEFIPRQHHLDVDGTLNQWQVWTECALNPIYPQGGTWIYDRAGWCPGAATDLKEWDISNIINPGQTAVMDYGMSSATGTSDYIVNHQLVSYGNANHTLDVSILEILNPTSRIEYQRTGSICTGPVIRIQNTGANSLNSAEIKYWLNNASTPQVYNWTGSLDFMEIAEVNLPIGTLWNDLAGGTEIMHVEVNKPNGGADDYAYNNTMFSSFNIPDVMPSDLMLRYKANDVAHQNSFEIRDWANNIVYSRSNYTSGLNHYDTLNLVEGCYTLIFKDSGENGISFWAAPDDGYGQLEFRRASSGLSLHTFEGDFGAEMRYEFTINSPLDYDELNPVLTTKVYPNPAEDRVTIELKDAAKAEVLVYSNTGQLMQAKKDVYESYIMLNTRGLSTGVYTVQIKTAKGIENHKLLVQ